MKVYSLPQCVQCDASKRKLDDLDAEYTVVDMSKDAAARELIAGLGFLQAPVVITDSGETWSGYRPDLLKKHAITKKEAHVG